MFTERGARWPFHPTPADGESLSSWIERIAHRYQHNFYGFMPLIGPDLRMEQVDVDPPANLVSELARKTGVPLRRIRAMSASGWAPWLYDDWNTCGGFDTYTHQHAVLLRGPRALRSLPAWRAWMPPSPLSRGCPLCLGGPVDEVVMQLSWSLPLMLSCPLHGCMLEEYRQPYGAPWLTGSEWPAPRQASDAVARMDHWTQQALQDGVVDLPSRQVHAAIWFRVLRTILDEIVAIRTDGGNRQSVRRTWAKAEQSRPQRRWSPFETLDLRSQTQSLTVAASAIELIESGRLSRLGRDSCLFVVERAVPVPESALYLSYDGTTDWFALMRHAMLEFTASTQHVSDAAAGSSRRQPPH